MIKKFSKKRILNYDYVKFKFKKEGYLLLSKTYKGNQQKLKYICDKGHNSIITYAMFRAGCRCRMCWIERNKKLNKKNNNPAWKGGVKKKNIPLYNTYAHQISWCEEVRRDPENENYLQVKCKESSCKKWFNPTTVSVNNRIQAIHGKLTERAENNFYCSEECKKSCSIFGQRIYPKENKPYLYRKDQKDWADLIKERDNYICQRCGSTKDLIAHHIEGLNLNPIESADVDLGITLCTKCDKLAHLEEGCRKIDLTKDKLC